MPGGKNGGGCGLLVVGEANSSEGDGELALPVIDHDLPLEDLRGAIGHRRFDAGRSDAFQWLAGVAHVVRHYHTIIGHVLGPSQAGQGEDDQTERQERPGEDGERSSMLGQGARSWYEATGL